MTPRTKTTKSLKALAPDLARITQELNCIDLEASELSENNRRLEVLHILDPVRGNGLPAERRRALAMAEKAREVKLQALENRASALIGANIDLSRIPGLTRDLGNLLRLLRVQNF